MSRFRSVFTNRHVVLPIINVSSSQQALRNVRIAREAGADGAFLISHLGIPDDELLDIHRELTQSEPNFWLGVNCVGLDVVDVFQRAGKHVDGVWVDDALIDENRQEQLAALEVQQTQNDSGWQGLYFGGVAFKYQRSVRDISQAARIACEFMDVVTTSGPGTGMAARPEKIRTMKEAIGDFPLAVASGITPENVTDYLHWADCYLASTGVSYTIEELDPARVRDLVRIVRAWRPNIIRESLR